MNDEIHTHLELDIQGVGKGLYRCTTRRGRQVLHMDVINPQKSSARGKFLRELAGKARDRGIELDPAECEVLLLQQLPETGSAPAGHQLAPNEILQTVGLEVLGEWPDHSVELFATQSRRGWRIGSVAKWQGEEMLQLLGPGVEEVFTIDRCSPPHMLTPRNLKRAVALAAAESPKLCDGAMLGQGVWYHDEQVLVVNGAHAWAYDGRAVEPILRPACADKILGLDPGAAWADEGLIQLLQDMTPDVARGAIERLEQYLGQWNWTHPTDVFVQAALVPATLVQSCWTWRPLNAIVGATDTGKSTLLQQLIRPLLGPGAIAVDRPTEAGLRQRIGHSSLPVLIDEFDEYPHRQAVLTLFRSSSRGATVLRGTTSHTAVGHTLNHIPWFAAIELGDMWAQDRNRFIRSQLRPPQNRGCLNLPPNAEREELHRQLTAAAIWAIRSARRVALEIQREPIPGVPGRIGESYAVPAAMSAVLHDGKEVSNLRALEILQYMVAGRDELLGPSEPDEWQLLRDILAAVPDWQFGGQRQPAAPKSIAAILAEHFGQCGHIASAETRAQLDALEAYGLRALELQSGERGVFLCHDVVRQGLLADTRWHGCRIDTILLRLPRADRKQERISGQDRRYGIFIPYVCCLELVLERDTA